MTLNRRLMLLVGSAILPLILSQLGFEALTYRADVRQETAKAQAVARSVIMLVECEIEIRMAAMEALATARSLREGDLAGFRERAVEVIQQRFPRASVVLLRQDGQQLVNTRYAWGAALPVRTERESLDRVFATGKPAVSDLFKRGGELIIAIDVPVFDRTGRVAYALSLNPQIAMFDAVLKAQDIPQTWVISVFDRTGTNISRVPNGNEFRGHRASDTLYGSLMAEADGTRPTTSLEGIPLLTAWVHGPLFGWSVAIGVPRAELTAPAWRAVMTALLIGGLITAISICLAVYAARGIAGPILRLRRLATEREVNDWQPARLPEVDEVAQALIDAEVDRKAREQRMREMQSELMHVARLSTIGQMASAISHELMQPLTAAQSYAGALTRLPLDGRVREAAFKIGEQIKRAGEVVHRVRDLAARRPAKLVPDAINDVVDEALKLALIGVSAGIAVRFDAAADLPLVPLDRVLVEQAVINLVRNAIEAMADAETRRLTLRTSLVEDGVEISIADTGPGFSDEVTERLFQPFVTTKATGLGLGLSICRDLVEAHNGKIDVENSEAGATVRISLPVAKSAATNFEGE